MAPPAEVSRASVCLVRLPVPLAFHGCTDEEDELVLEDDSLLTEETDEEDDDKLELDHREDDEYSASPQLPSRFTGSILTVVLS